MAVYDGSRYESTEIVRPVNKLGEAHPVLLNRPPKLAEGFSYELYTVEEGERPDHIAYFFYGDPEMWWLIADANPEILHPTALTPGQAIRIPDIEEADVFDDDDYFEAS